MNHNNPDNFFADPGPHARQNFGGVYITSPQPAPCEVNWIGNPSRTVVSTRPTDAELADLRQQLAAANARAEKLNQSETQLIQERDDAEEAMSQAYFLVTGKSAEWSNLFGYTQANEEIDDAQRLLRESLAAEKKRAEQAERDRDTLAKELGILRKGFAAKGDSDVLCWFNASHEIIDNYTKAAEATDASGALDRAGGGG